MRWLLILLSFFSLHSGAALAYTAGNIYTVAGNGSQGYSGDNGPAMSAQFNRPGLLTVDAAGNLIIADIQNNRIRKVAPNGTITTVAGTGGLGYSGDNGLATSAQLYTPYGVAVDGAGNLYVGDHGNDRIRKVASNGTITTAAGTGVRGYSGDNGPATSAQLYTPIGVAVDGVGNLYIADLRNHRIRKVAPNGTITTVAGTGVAGYSGDNGPATSAQLNNPGGVAVDGAGNLYFSDAGNYRIRKITPNGTISTVAGTGVAGYSGDNGSATSAQLNSPFGVAVDGAGNLYIADYGNNRIRKVAPNGIITTVAGTGAAGYSGDNGTATSAQLSLPIGVAVDSAGNLYIGDTYNDRVRMISGSISIAPSNGLVGYWSFDQGNAGITEGTANSGLPTGGVTFGPGKFGGAALFGGVANPGHIRIPNSAALQFSTGATYSVWVRFDSLSGMTAWDNTGGMAAVLAKSHDRAGAGFMLYTKANKEFFTEIATYERWVATGSGALWAPSKGVGEWAHVAWTLSSANGYKTYIDGKLYSQGYTPVPFVSMNSQDLYLGKFSDSYYPLHGALDELRIYNRVLSDAEIATLAGASGTALTPQSIAFGPIPSVTVGSSSSVSATASSGLPVTFSSLTASICTVSDHTVTGIATGTCIIAANQAGNSSTSPATPVTQSFSIAAPATYTLTVNSSGVAGVPISSLPTTYAGTTGYSKSGIAAGTNIVLTAPATTGSLTFKNWSGCDVASGVTCSVTINAAKNVTVDYGTAAQPVLRKAIEFYQSTLKHYFITLDAGEAVGIDAGAAGPGWTRTGGSFNVWSAPASGSQPVCRFYGSFSPGPNSHFFTVDADECAALRAQQTSTPETVKKWHYEGIAFYMAKPLNAACAGGTVPVYRYYNNGYAYGEDANHRLTTDLSQRAKMEANGWSQEGTVMCAEVSAATAAFTFNAAALFKGQAIAFTDTSTGRPTAWYWTFGDGSSSSVQHPVHLYSTAGTFVVTLTTSTAQGGDYTARTLVIAEQGSGGGDGGGGGGGD